MENKEELRNKKKVHGKGGKDQMEEDEGRAGRGEEKKKLGWKGEKDGMEWSLWKEVYEAKRNVEIDFLLLCRQSKQALPFSESKPFQSQWESRTQKMDERGGEGGGELDKERR